jgi:hypothetical protein
METILNAVQGFFERYPLARTLGKVTSPAEIEALPAKIKNAIPDWYKDLILQFPIANLPLGIPNDFGQPLLKGRSKEQLPLMEITFHPVGDIVKISETIFPNHLLLKKKFIGIAQDQKSTGEEIFIDAKATNPPVTMILHDMGDSVKELVRNGERLVDKFSDLFVLGKLTNDRVKLTEENRQLKISLIQEFFRFVDTEIKHTEDKLKAELPDPSRLFEGINQRDRKIKNEEYILALLRFEWGLYDSGYPLTRKHLDHLTEIYKACDLHIPDLVFIEERVSNRAG